jgi:hypothetical protein
VVESENKNDSIAASPTGFIAKVSFQSPLVSFGRVQMALGMSEHLGMILPVKREDVAGTVDVLFIAKVLFIVDVGFKEIVVGLVPIVVLGTRGVVEAAKVSRLVMAVLFREPEVFVIHPDGKTLEHSVSVEKEGVATVPVPFPYGTPIWVLPEIGCAVAVLTITAGVVAAAAAAAAAPPTLDTSAELMAPVDDATAKAVSVSVSVLVCSRRVLD